MKTYRLILEVEFQHSDTDTKAVALEKHTKLLQWFRNHSTKPKILTFEVEDAEYPKVDIEKI